MDRKAGHDGVEAAEVGYRLGKVMSHDLHTRLVGKPLARGFDHRLGHVEPNADAVGSAHPQQSEQASITRAEIEDSPGVARWPQAAASAWFRRLPAAARELLTVA